MSEDFIQGIFFGVVVGTIVMFAGACTIVYYRAKKQIESRK